MFISIVVFMLIRFLINRLLRRLPGRVLRIINWFLIFCGIISWILLFWRFITTVRAHVKPLHDNGAGKMHPIEYLNQTDELHLVSLASNPATPPPFRRGNNVSIASLPPLSEFNFFTLAAVSPPLPQPVMQLTNNVTICGCPQRNPPLMSKVDNEASCLAVDLVQEMNTEIEQE